MSIELKTTAEVLKETARENKYLRRRCEIQSEMIEIYTIQPGWLPPKEQARYDELKAALAALEQENKT